MFTWGHILEQKPQSRQEYKIKNDAYNWNDPIALISKHNAGINSV